MDRFGGKNCMCVKMVSAASRASDQDVWGLYRCIFSWWFQWDHRRPCPTSAAGDITNFVKSSFGGLRDLWSGCLGCLWMHLFMAVLMTPSAAGATLFSHGGGPIGPHLRHHIRLCTLTFTFGGKGVIRSGRHLTAAVLSSRSDVIRIVFSLLMSPSLVCWIGPTAVRKKVARVPLRRGLKKGWTAVPHPVV